MPDVINIFVKSTMLLALITFSAPDAGLAATLSVDSFGAIANDAKSDTRAINQALKKSREGDTVLLGRGEYLIRGEIRGKSGITLAGQGRGKTTIRAQNVSWTQESLINIDSVKGMSVQDLTLDANWNPYIPYGVRGGHDGGNNRLTRISIRNIKAHDPYGSGPVGILVSDQPDTVISYNHIFHIKNKDGTGAAIGLYGGPYSVTENVINDVGRNGIYALRCSGEISRNRVTNSGTGSEPGDTGISIELHSGDNEGGCHGVLIENNQVDSWISVVRASNAAIRSNKIGHTRQDKRYAGIEASGENMIISNNHVGRGVNTGIIIERPSFNIVVYDNEIRQFALFGLSLIGARPEEDPSNWLIENVLIDNNSIEPISTLPSSKGDPTSAGTAVEITRNAFRITLSNNDISYGDANAVLLSKRKGDNGPNYLFANNNQFRGKKTALLKFHPVPLFKSLSINSYANTPSQRLARRFVKKHSDIVSPSIRITGSSTPKKHKLLRFSLTGISDVNPENILWDFGEGIPVTGTHASHAFESPGRYKISVTAWSKTGQATRVSLSVKIP